MLFFTATIISKASGQLATFDFDENLTDTSGTVAAEYQVNAVTTTASPDYVNGVSGSAVHLGIEEGVVLPLSFNAHLDLDSSIQVQFQFNITDLGEGDGRKLLLSMKEDAAENAGGIMVFVMKQLDRENKYRLWLNYTDGGFERNVPDHPGAFFGEIGLFEVGDWVDFNLVFDFANKNWSTQANTQFNTESLWENLDYDMLKDIVLNNHITLGFENGVEEAIAAIPDLFTAAVAIDELKIYSPRSNGNASILQSSLQAMINHVDNTAPISQAELINHFNAIVSNFNGNYDNFKSEINTYLDIYEAANDPIFIEPRTFNLKDLPIEDQLTIFLQQWIHDNLFTPENIDQVAGIKFEAAEAWPGKVEESAPRVEHASVVIDGTHNVIPGARILHDELPAIRPTGYYAAPGELVTIEVDAQYIDKGLTVQVGAHSVDLSSRQDDINRYVRVSKSFPLDITTIKVGNPFGGGIYILVPSGNTLGDIPLTISSAVKSPYFSTRSGYESEINEWLEGIEDNHVWWVDLESDKVMFTIPLIYARDAGDPSAFMKLFDDIMVTYREIAGRPIEQARAEYFLTDSRLPFNAFGAGYPQITGDYKAPYDGEINTWLNPFSVLDPEIYTTEITTMFHEMGHTARLPTLPGEDETIVNIHAPMIFNTLMDVPLDTAFKYSASQKMTIEEAAMDWLITPNFRSNDNMGCSPTYDIGECYNELQYQHRGHLKYIEIVNIWGWEGLGKIHQEFYEKWKVEPPFDYRVERDEYIQLASEALNTNTAPLFHLWGVIPSEDLVEQLESMPKSDEILERLRYYRSLVPKNVEDFQEWYDRLYEKAGSSWYEVYDEVLRDFESQDIGQQMVDQINFIIEKYYGTTSTQSPSNQIEAFNIAPNPFNEVLEVDIKINIAGPYQISMTDLVGNVVYNQRFSLPSGKSRFTIRPSIALPPGVYILDVKNRDLNVSRKVLKQ